MREIKNDIFANCLTADELQIAMFNDRTKLSKLNERNKIFSKIGLQILSDNCLANASLEEQLFFLVFFSSAFCKGVEERNHILKTAKGHVVVEEVAYPFSKKISMYSRIEQTVLDFLSPHHLFNAMFDKQFITNLSTSTDSVSTLVNKFVTKVDFDNKDTLVSVLRDSRIYGMLRSFDTEAAQILENGKHKYCFNHQMFSNAVLRVSSDDYRLSTLIAAL